MREQITKTYAKSVGRQIGPSPIDMITFGKQAKRMDGDWDVRWVWKIEVSDRKYEEECKWVGFKTLPACMKDLDRAINKIMDKYKKENGDNEKNSNEKNTKGSKRANSKNYEEADATEL